MANIISWKHRNELWIICLCMHSALSVDDRPIQRLTWYIVRLQVVTCISRMIRPGLKWKRQPSTRLIAFGGEEWGHGVEEVGGQHASVAIFFNLQEEGEEIIIEEKSCTVLIRVEDYNWLEAGLWWPEQKWFLSVCPPDDRILIYFLAGPDNHRTEGSKTSDSTTIALRDIRTETQPPPQCSTSHKQLQSVQ